MSLVLGPDHVKRAADSLGLGPTVTNLAVEIAQDAGGKSGLNVGHTPRLVAAASLYIAIEQYRPNPWDIERPTQNEIAEVLGCCTAALRDARDSIVDSRVQI